LDAPFVPNDVKLDHSNSRLILITGPNMAGKSTVLRQTALIVLMAHTGSFVPAASAEIGLTDQIFTRVGATDYLARGQSTFMVEMSETANILRNATSRSLVILDEIGRGTSTYDGLSIAWAVAEHLLGRDNGKGTKTLFATHYHELTELAHRYHNVINMHVAVKEWKHRIIFLHRLREGATNKSYGIQVAALAGVPDSVVKNATNILQRIEKQAATAKHKAEAGVLEPRPVVRITQQALPLVMESDQSIRLLRQKLMEADINNITPMQALNLLAELREMAAEE
jgi:DNA mismatch repair protein MutS